MRLFIYIFLLPLIAYANLGSPQLPAFTEDPGQIVVNNRILTKINGKTISVIDVMKKMDVFINRYYPEMTSSKAARYQFYTSQWKEVLQQMITSELMVADAESREIKVSDGEIREEVQARFGPNVMGTLDKLGISYEEARKMIHEEMLVQRMNWLRVSSKVLQQVSIPDIRSAYEKYCLENPPKEEWEYQVLSIRSEGEKISALLASRASELLSQKHLALADLAESLKAETPPEEVASLETPAASIQLSQEYKVDNKDLSEAHRNILQTLKVGALSLPITQKSKDGSTVCRVFQLKSHVKKEAPTFEELAGPIKDSLLQKAAEREMAAYVHRLQVRFGYDEKALDLPPDFQPFVLR